MAEGTIFPAFLKLEYQDDGSAKTRFLQAVDDITVPAEQRFAEFGAEAKRQIDSVVQSMASSTASTGWATRSSAAWVTSSMP